MPTKVSWLFNGIQQERGAAGGGAAPIQGGDRVWGFSESWYTGLEGDALLVQMLGLMEARRLILSADTRHVAFRIGQANGRSFVHRVGFRAPAANDQSNLPVDAVLCEVGVLNSTARKKFWLHDLPDDWVTGVSLVPARRAAILRVVQAYCDLGFQVRHVVQTAANAPVLSVDANGNVVTTADIALAVNSLVTFLKCKDTNGRAVRGTYAVETVTDATHFKLKHWTGVTVGRSGKIRLQTYGFGTGVYLGERSIVAAGSRKVGRPFFQFRGRAVARR